MIGNVFYFEWEVRLMETLQAAMPAWLITLISQFSLLGESTLMVVILGFLYWSWDKKAARYVGLNLLTACVWNPMIKNVFLRRRPYFDNEGITLYRLIEKDADMYDIAAQGFSFPSGHSTSAVATYGSLRAIFRNRWFTVLAVLAPLLVGISRVVVGAHYPTDVLVGWALGLVVIFLVPFLEMKTGSRKVLYTVLLVSGLPGFFYCTSDDFFTSYGLLAGFILATLFEEKYVNFKNTREPVRMVLRVLGGGAIYLCLNTVLKLPFSEAFLDSGTMAAHLVRSGRYFIVIFVIIAIYPLLFDRFFVKKEK